MTKQEFLSKISTIVVNENNKRGRPLFPSVVIAQAICESAWGQSQLMMKANAVFGIKCGTSWRGKYYNAKTKECYDGKTYVSITDNFRAYNSLEESVKDYFDLICKSARYRKALVTESPRACITAIKNGGYATSPSYITTIMSIIDSNNLTKYDNFKSQNKINCDYIVGKTYTTKVDLNVRTGAGTNYRKKEFEELTFNAQLHSYKRTGVLKKGTKVTCQNIIINDDEIWFKIPSGYICANYKGKEYIK
jgi:hypothetical protein